MRKINVYTSTPEQIDKYIKQLQRKICCTPPCSSGIVSTTTYPASIGAIWSADIVVCGQTFNISSLDGTGATRLIQEYNLCISLLKILAESWSTLGTWFITTSGASSSPSIGLIPSSDCSGVFTVDYVSPPIE